MTAQKRATKKPAAKKAAGVGEKVPAKAGARLSVSDKRQRAQARKVLRDKFEAEHGQGYDALWNFIYEYETLGDWKEADPWVMERLFDCIKDIAASINRYLDHECRTMDEAFRVRRPDGYRRAAARKRHLHRHNVQICGRVLKSAGVVVDASFFEVIGDFVGVSKTQASEWYYEVRFPPYKQITDLPPALEKYRSMLRWKK